MKKRTLAYLVAAGACCVALVGGTLAYFTDSQVKENVFTTGNVDITLNEVFEQDSLLVPGLDVQKEVTVTNVGTLDSYVRVHIAVPKILDSGDPEFAAYANTLHWNFTRASFAEGLWSWGKTIDAPNYPGNGGAWNSYETTIDNVEYTVYVATYETALAKDETTADKAITKVYLDTKVTNEQMTEILGKLGEIKVYVAAEGCQTETFENAFDALNTAFGVPGTYDVDWSKIA